MKKIILILFCFITLNNTFASSKKLKEKDQYYKTASTIFDFMIYSEDAKEREEAKNDMIEFYKSSSESEKAVNKAYKETKKDLEGLENTEEYARLLTIGSILGLK